MVVRQVKLDLLTNRVVITDAIKFVQTSKEKLKSSKEDVKEPEEVDYDENKQEVKEKQHQQYTLIIIFLIAITATITFWFQ
jgi:hypothetical protein